MRLHVEVEHHALLDAVIADGERGEPRDLGAFDRGQKAEMPEIDAEDGLLRLRGADTVIEHHAVAAENDQYIRVRDHIVFVIIEPDEVAKLAKPIFHVLIEQGRNVTVRKRADDFFGVGEIFVAGEFRDDRGGVGNYHREVSFRESQSSSCTTAEMSIAAVFGSPTEKRAKYSRLPSPPVIGDGASAMG